MAASQSVHDGADIGQCHAGSHRMRWVRPVRGGFSARLDCARPVLWVCGDCGECEQRRCNATKESQCRPCSSRYRGRIREIAFSGCGRSTGYHYFLTTTAPSDTHYMPSGDECPCGVRDFDLAVWNASHSARWNHFRTILRRELSPTAEFMRGVEVQKRGALHDHVIIWSPVPLTKKQLKALALRAGFGHSIDLVPVQPGSKKIAYYISKYVTKATDARGVVPWWGITHVDFETGEVTEGLVRNAPYRTWSMSRGYGLKMADIRARGLAYVKILEAKAAEAGVVRLLAAFGGQLTPIAVGSPGG
jgi:hypothetical protein